MAAGLRHALERGGLDLLYQPKIDPAQGRIRGADALLRWRSADLGEVLREDLVPVAVETGKIQEIGTWATHCTWTQLRRDPLPGREELRITVNLSAAQLRTGKAAEELLGVVEERGRDAGVIVRAILSMVCALGLEVVAEGVEAQVALLFAEGCNFAQGFDFKRPVSGGQLLDVRRAETNQP